MEIKSLSLKDSFRIALKDTLKITLFIFLLILSSKIRVYLPYLPVPLTFQTLIVFLTVVFLKRKAIFVQLGWIGLGFLGFSVFSQGGGFFYLLGPTAGYILGFLVATILLVKILFLKKSLAWYIFSFSLANVIIYILGVIGILVNLRTSLNKAFVIGVLPFIYGDSLKIILASLITRLKRSPN